MVTTSVQSVPKRSAGTPESGLAGHAGLYFISDASRNGLQTKVLPPLGSKLKMANCLLPVSGDVLVVICRKMFFQRGSHVGARKIWIPNHYRVYRRFLVDKLVHVHAFCPKNALIHALRSATVVLALHVPRWDPHSLASAASAQLLDAVSIPTTIMVGAAVMCAGN